MLAGATQGVVSLVLAGATSGPVTRRQEKLRRSADRSEN